MSPVEASVRCYKLRGPPRIEIDSVAEKILPPPSFTGRMPLGTTSRGALVYARNDLPLPVAHVRAGRGYRSAARSQYTARVDAHGEVSSVTESLAWRIVGQSATGNGYTRWAPNTITVIRRLPSGRHTVYRRVWARGGERRFGFAIYAGDHTVSEELQELAGELLGPAPDFVAMHPLLRGGDRYAIQHQGFMQNFWQVADVAALTRNLFGISRYRKDLVKAVARARPLGLFASWSMRGLVPTDWLVDLLHRDTAESAGEALQGWDSHVPAGDLRPHLRQLDTVTLRRLSRNLTGFTGHSLQDLTAMPVAEPVKLRTWEELHDHTARADRAMRVRSLQSRLFAGRGQRLFDAERGTFTGITTGGMHVVAAIRPETLLTWGDEAQNCIASYQLDFVCGAVHLLGVYSGRGLIANVEIRRGHPHRLRQLLGRYNQVLPRVQHDDVVEFLISRGVDCRGPYIGRLG